MLINVDAEKSLNNLELFIAKLPFHVACQASNKKKHMVIVCNSEILWSTLVPWWFQGTLSCCHMCCLCLLDCTSCTFSFLLNTSTSKSQSKLYNIQQNHRTQAKKHPDFYQYPWHFIDRTHQKFQTYLCSSMVPRRKIEARVRNASCLKVFQWLITWHEWNGDINAIVSVHGGYEISIYIFLASCYQQWYAAHMDSLKMVLVLILVNT